MEKPSWLELLAPLPAGLVPTRKPVASAEQIAQGTAGPIAGWQSLAVHLSGEGGLRNVLVTLDETGKVLSAGDHVMLVSTEWRGAATVSVYNHQSVGGRFEDDGSFLGTRWRSRSEEAGDTDDATQITSTSSKPSDDDVAALRRIVNDVISRAP